MSGRVSEWVEAIGLGLVFLVVGLILVIQAIVRFA